MTTKHTPGPWAANETNQINYMGDTYNADVVWSANMDRGPVAFIPLRAPEESVANARLIAAAPELLAALEACASFVDPSEQCKRHWTNGDVRELTEQTRTAIAKAKA